MSKWTSPTGTVARGDRAHVRLGDRVVASQNDRDRARGDGLPDRALDLRVCPLRIGRNYCGVAEVDDAELGERVDLRLEMRPGRTAGGADRARAKARSGPVGDEVVRRRADHRNVDTGELGGVLGVRHAGVGEEPGVVGLVGQAELAPALEWIDHLAGLDDGVRLADGLDTSQTPDQPSGQSMTTPGSDRR